MPHDAIKRCLLVGSLLLLVACRTAPHVQPQPADSFRGGAPTALVYVPSSPTVLVARGDQGFVLLNATVVQVEDGPAFVGAYLASADATGARTEEAARHALASAALLVETFSPLLPPEIRRAEVMAVYGAPGAMGAAIPVHLTRDGGAWSERRIEATRPVVVPPLPAQLGRHVQRERAAVAVARSFLERTDDHDGDAAWELASAAIKVAMSRRSFEAVLWPAGWKGAHRQRRELFRQYAAHVADFALGDHLLVFFVSEAGVEGVQVRLDDDQEWRVAEYARPVTEPRQRDTPSPNVAPWVSAAPALLSRTAAGPAW